MDDALSLLLCAPNLIRTPFRSVLTPPRRRGIQVTYKLYQTELLMTATIYHNPRCSKSRATLALLEENGVTPEIVAYLETPPSKAELSTILDRLGMQPRELIRKKEEPYKALNLADESLDRDALIDAMIEHPILIERPVVVKDGKYALGRPPENVLRIL